MELEQRTQSYNLEFPSWTKEDPLCKEAYDNPEFDPVQILKAVYLNPSHRDYWNICSPTLNKVRYVNSGVWVQENYKCWFNEYLRRAIVFYYREKPDTFTYDKEPVPMMTYMICECKEKGDEKNKYYKYYESVKAMLSAFF